MRLKPMGKLVVFLLVAGAAAGLWRSGLLGKIIPAASGPGSTDVKVGTGTEVSSPDSASTGGPVTIPGSEVGCTDKPEVRMLGYAWNAQMGALFATGGPQATKGSLMCENGVNFKWARQDDNSKLQENLTAFATAVSRGEKNPTAGVHFVTIMGDGAAAFLKGLNDVLKKIGPEYQAKIVGSCGYSHGEDKFMGPAEWKANPRAAMGGLVAGVVRDGDWNIAQKWLSDNGLRTNPNEKTWDPDALNWVNSSDYIDAAQKYISGYSEDRPVVRNGKPTGETKHITVNSVVTWTPGDVTIAQKKGGLVSIVSTKEYSSQMPCVIIGIDKWMKQNRPLVQAMLKAIGQGSDAVKGNAAALHKGAEIAAVCFKEQDAAYWEKYFKGTQEKDATGQMVDLGGSSVSNLADMLLAFGQVEGSSNLVATTYRVFGDVVVAQYPSLVPNYPSPDTAIDTSYLAGLKQTSRPTQAEIKSVQPKFAGSDKPQAVVSRRRWDIKFTTGTANFTPDALRALEKMKRDMLVANGTTIEVHGHTDSQGNADKNYALSEARAFAVKRWLQKQSPINFPDARIQVIAHGQTQPLAENSTESGRARNRRVEITLLTTSR